MAESENLKYTDVEEMLNTINKRFDDIKMRIEKVRSKLVRLQDIVGDGSKE